MDERYIILKDGNKNIPQLTGEVSYFRANGNFALVYLLNGTFSKQSNGLKEWENEQSVVSSGDFVRVHESYMLNWHNVKSFDRSIAVMDDKDKTPIPLTAEGFKKLKEKYSKQSSTAPFRLIPLFLPRSKDERNDEEE